MGLGHVNLSTKWNIFKAVLRWLPRYNSAYYAEIGSKSWRTLLGWATWHTFVLILPTAYFLGLAQSFVIWFLFWFAPMFVSLPVLRSIAEAEEHDYERGETELDSTFTNDGWIHHLLWHPWGDAYHQVHHLFPNISQRRHRQVHKLLMIHDPKYQSSPIRKKTLDMLTQGR
jgi:fatty acid desaturase